MAVYTYESEATGALSESSAASEPTDEDDEDAEDENDDGGSPDEVGCRDDSNSCFQELQGIVVDDQPNASAEQSEANQLQSTERIRL